MPQVQEAVRHVPKVEIQAVGVTQIQCVWKFIEEPQLQGTVEGSGWNQFVDFS